MKRWSEEDIKLIYLIYPNEGAVPIISKTGRSRNAINKMAFRLGVSTTTETRHRIQSEMGKVSTVCMKGESNPNWKGGRSKNTYWYKKRMKDKYPDKHRARNILQGAVKHGRIIKKPCEVCGDSNSQGHHNDYSKPLEVVWLCRKHHNKLHNDMKCK